MPSRRSGGLPSLRCHAKAKSTGEQCKQFAIVGGVVCNRHGGSAGAAVRKADLRVSLSQLLGQDPRPPWQVLLDALKASDALMQDGLRVVSEAGESVTPDQLDRFVSALERAAKLSKMTLDANVGERRTRLLEAQSDLMADSIAAGIDAVFARLALQFQLSPDQEVELRQLALTTAAERAEVADDPRALRPSRDGPLARDVRSVNKLKRMPPWIPKKDQPEDQPEAQPGAQPEQQLEGDVVPLRPPRSPLEE